MERGRITIKVNRDAHPSGEMVVKAYLPYPGLAVHRLVPSNYLDVRRAARWHRWDITHVNSGLKVNNDYFNRLRDALLACKMIADMLPWTSSSDKITDSSTIRRRIVRKIIHYAREGYDEAQISSLVLESELESGE